MSAQARIVAEGDGTGGTRLTVLHGEVPLLPRRTGPGTVHLVGGAAGPLGGDRLRLDITVGAGAHLRVHSVAATVALPGPGTSTMEIAVTVAAGGRLDWLPEPLIAARGCAHIASSTIDLAAGATLVWRDELVCGRHGEVGGDVTVSTAVTLAGRPLYRHELSVGPAADGWAGAAVLGGAGAHGSLFVVDAAWADGGAPAAGTSGRTAAVMPLAGPAVLASAVGCDLRAVRAELDSLTSRVCPILRSAA